MYNGKTVAALIAAGGIGIRFGADIPKQFVEINGRSMLVCSVRPFLRNPFVDEIIVLAPAGFEQQTRDLLARELGSGLSCRADTAAGVSADMGTGAATDGMSADMGMDGFMGGTAAECRLRVVSGGTDRQASVRQGLEAAKGRSGLVLIHDAARPFVTEDLINRVLDAAFEHGAAVPCVPVRDTIYETSADGVGSPARASKALDRKRLAAAQTPQGFDFSLIEDAHRFAAADGIAVTDDGMPVMAYGRPVRIVEGDPANRKITAPEDMSSFGQYRAGIGFDAHAFRKPADAGGQSWPLVLGGVEIPFEKGLEGHSDADVLTHALMDAILGALHAGDIGKLFPDTDAAYRGISSLLLLKRVARLMRDRGFALENADMTIVAERPRMAPHRETIENSLAKTLGTTPENVSVKATTTEKLGFAGREEGIAAEAVVLLKKIAEREQ
jgi:2-C-methyl-D-erythritol 2,4-cyclodiphosphate synthase/2-C-methyl-D-erythritol 4-phosphate cytidylyltransferase